MPMTLDELKQVRDALKGLDAVERLEASTQSAVDAAATQAGSVELADGLAALALVLDDGSVKELRARVDVAKARVGLVPDDYKPTVLETVVGVREVKG
jgi:hypothetical protein